MVLAIFQPSPPPLLSPNPHNNHTTPHADRPPAIHALTLSLLAAATATDPGRDVTGVSSRIDAASGRGQALASFEVEKSFKGELAGHITLTEWGGHLGECNDCCAFTQRDEGHRNHEREGDGQRLRIHDDSQA